jgi:hypothetical protein
MGFNFDDLLEDVGIPVEKEEEKREEDKVTEEQVKEVFTKKAIDVAKINSLEPDFSDEFKDMMQEVKKYFRNTYDIKQRMQELKDELKDIKQEAKEIGIKVSVVDKAMKEVINEIKESSEDAKYIEDTKRLIKEDNDLYNIAVIEAG